MKLSQAQLARIKSLEDAHGRITASAVVRDAKKKASPLHSLFNWNMKHAAEAWWLQRARVIIQNVTVQVVTNTATIKAPFYSFDPNKKGEGYRSVIALRSEPDAARESLIYCLETAAGHLRRGFDMASGLGLQNEVDALLAQVAGVARLVREAAA